jgi:CubicO group peptidase (beta-lactamase class C family)
MTTAPLARMIGLLAALCFAPVAWGDDLSSKFEQYMDAAVKVDRFCGSVLVSREGQTLFNRGYGMANIEHDIPNTPGTKFRLGSITKQFTAMAVLILHEQGKLQLDDPIGKFLEDSPKAWDGVTIHHLLTHTSGVHSYTSEPDYMKKMAYPETVKSMIARFKDKPLDFAPGEKFAYSNSGYFLLGALIEKVSGTSYEAFLKQAIFEPLGMKDSGYDLPKTVLPRRASGYRRFGDKLENAEYLDMAQPYAAGSLYSTVEDLAKWDHALNEGKLISKDSYVKMYTPVKNDYAYGWAVTTFSGRKEIGHGGGINGFATQIVRYPEEKVCVVVLCNVLPSNPGKVAHDLAAITLGDDYKLPAERKVAKVDPKIYDAYVGRYRIGADKAMFLSVTREGDRLMAQPTGQTKLQILPESETEFFLEGPEIKLTFVKDEKGKVTHVLVRQGRKDEEKAMRVDSDEPAEKKAEPPKGADKPGGDV